MALLRLIVVAAIAWCAVPRAVAGIPPVATAKPGSSVSGVPPGWTSAPALAKAAADAATSDVVSVIAANAWSEPSLGCYVTSVTLHGGALPVTYAADELVASVQKAGMTLSEIVKPGEGPEGVLAISFAKAPYHGMLRANLAGTGDVTTLTCMWNERAPKACKAACAKLVEAHP